MPADIDQSAPIAEQAAQWWLTLHSEEVSVNERHEFDAWVAQSPERIAAYLRTALLMKAVTSSKLRWPETTAEALIDEAKCSLRQGVRVLHERSQPSVVGSRRHRLPTRRWLATATATALFAAIATAWFVSAIPQEFHTGFGERRSVLLSDGSMVTLNSESRIRVDLRKGRRLVSLEAGEALFRVAHAAARPFEVNIGNAVVRDIDTEFDIKRRARQTILTVITGKVVVAEESARAAEHLPAPGQPGAVFLGPAERLVIVEGEWATPQHNVNVRAAVAWAQNKLIFEHTPLSEAAEEFNRYNRRRIEIQGEQLQRREVSGVFQADDPKSFFAFLSGVPGMTVHEAADGTHIVAQN